VCAWRDRERITRRASPTDSSGHHNTTTMRASAILLAFALAVNAAPRHLRDEGGLVVPADKPTPFQEEKLQRKQARLAAKKMEQDRAKKDRKTQPAAPAEGAAGQRRLAGTQDDMAAVFTAAHPSWTTCLTESGGTPADPCSSTKITCVGTDVTEINFSSLWSDSGDCELQGSIPKELGAITTLTELHLDWNNLHGTVPVELGDLTSLTEIDLDYNDALWGNLPLAWSTQAWGEYASFEVSLGNEGLNVAPCLTGETEGSTVPEAEGGVMCFSDTQRAGQYPPGSDVCEDPANFNPDAMTTETPPEVCGSSTPGSLGCFWNGDDYNSCCTDGKTSCDGASSTVLATTAAVVAAVVALASI